jgi:mgtE-like transporter
VARRRGEETARRPLRALTGRVHLPRGDVRQSLVALALNSTTSFIAGATLAAVIDHIGGVPKGELIVLVPAAIGLRGNVFSALGNRLSTSVHVGTFRFSLRRDSLFAQNVAASMALTMAISLLIALGTAVLVVGLGISDSPDVLDLALVSILGGTLASVVVLGATTALTLLAVRYGWDLDNLVAPIVSTLGDVLTIPALWCAALLVGVPGLAPATAIVLIVGTVGLTVAAWRSGLAVLRRIMRESAPVLSAAAGLSTLAGVALSKRLSIFEAYFALFVFQPAFVSSVGALGGIMASRLATGFQLGTMDPDTRPGRGAREVGALVLGLALPVALFNAVGAQTFAWVLGESSPGLLRLGAVAVIASAVAMAWVLAVAYYGTAAATRTGLDPDTYGVPIVTSSVDFVGALALIVAVVLLGIA